MIITLAVPVKTSNIWAFGSIGMIDMGHNMNKELGPTISANR